MLSNSFQTYESELVGILLGANIYDYVLRYFFVVKMVQYHVVKIVVLSENESVCSTILK